MKIQNTILQKENLKTSHINGDFNGNNPGTFL